MWSSAGVVTRQLEAARSFEITFWRSAFNAVALVAVLGAWRGRAWLGVLQRGGRMLWASGLCWAVMFTAFMVALSLTSVANVLVTMALAPLLTALFAWAFLRQAIPARTWFAIGLATLGIAWMFGRQAGLSGGLTGVWVGLGVPFAAATNWCLMQHASHGEQAPGVGDDMLLAVLIGAVISAGCTLPLAWPLQASGHDLSLLGFLGVFQLALPCLLAVRLARTLPGHELSLIGQLEVLLGVLWAWLFAGERPHDAALLGGGLVLIALVLNELFAPATSNSSSSKQA
jgi:drug/metabolite transporter (DMT)-like permease